MLHEKALGAPASALHDIIERGRYPFGYKRGTPDYSRCLENLYVQDQQLAAAERVDDAASAQRIRNSLQQSGAAMPAIIRTNSSPAPRCPSTPEPICRLENQSEPDHSETGPRNNALRDRAGCVHLACLRRASVPRMRSSVRIQ